MVVKSEIDEHHAVPAIALNPLQDQNIETPDASPVVPRIVTCSIIPCEIVE